MQVAVELIPTLTAAAARLSGVSCNKYSIHWMLVNKFLLKVRKMVTWQTIAATIQPL